MKIFLDTDGILNIDEDKYSKIPSIWKPEGEKFDILILNSSTLKCRSLIGGQKNLKTQNILDKDENPYASVSDIYEAIKGFFVKASDSSGGLTPDQEFQLEEAYDERHVHDNIAILGAMEAAFTSALESKLKSLTDAYKGLFDNEVAIQNAYPLPSAGFNAWNVETETMWGVSNGIWIDTKSASFGDMLISTYDKTGVKADVFDFANMFGSFAKDLLPKYTTIDLGSLVKPFKNMHASGLVYAGGGVVLTDETTKLTYKLKVKDGSLYLEEL